MIIFESKRPLPVFFYAKAIFLLVWLMLPCKPLYAQGDLGLSNHASVFDIRINELMASNATTIQDESGEFEDWIELYNTGQGPFDVGARLAGGVELFDRGSHASASRRRCGHCPQ